MRQIGWRVPNDVSVCGFGATLVSFFATEPELAARFSKAYPQARQVAEPLEIFEDASIQLIVSAAIPNTRAAIGIATMQHGKDFMSDKPGFTKLEQLELARKVQAETKRIYSICYSERFEKLETVKAGELVQAGAIGVLETTFAEDYSQRAAQLDLNPGLWVRLHPQVKSFILADVLEK